MCGIAALLVSSQTSVAPDDILLGSSPKEKISSFCETDIVSSLRHCLRRRGPDGEGSCTIETKCATVHVLSSVLALRGDEPSHQPVRDKCGCALAYNGELYDVPENLSDTSIFMPLLHEQVSSGHNILQALDAQRGPWSFIFWDARQKRLWFARDVLGRRSLLVATIPAHGIVVTSVRPPGCTIQFAEVPPAGLYYVDVAGERPQFGFVRRACTELRRHSANDKENSAGSILSFLHSKWIREGSNGRKEELRQFGILDSPQTPELSAKLFLEKFRISIRRRLVCRKATAPRFAVLFSGGIDSLFLAAILDDELPAQDPLDLISIAFGGPLETSKCPDRANALSAYDELRSRSTSGRSLRLLLVDVSPQEADMALENVRCLLHPCSELMDASIGTALWLLGKATGYYADSGGASAFSPARILFSGLGADELMGGYKGRHRTTFRTGGESAILNEINIDLSRLWQRNLGRDDRVIADSGKEIRHPFLDEDLIDFVTSLPFTKHVCDLSMSDGVGDKHLLRRSAAMIGLSKEATTRSKRAIQFGCRSKQVLERKR